VPVGDGEPAEAWMAYGMQDVACAARIAESGAGEARRSSNRNA
jgi:ATP-dependent DNA helicase RecQ